jgi:predicted chitinase
MVLTKSSFDVLREELFGGSLSVIQVDSLNYLVQRCEEFVLTYPEAAYVLATAYHETGYVQNGVMVRDMLPIKERGGEAYLRSKRYYPHVGMGYVQLTWLENKVRVGKLLGIDLVTDPNSLLDPDIASEIMIKGMVFGWFTGVGFHRKCPVYRYNKASYVRARKIVNGTDKADLIAGYAMIFEKALRS